MKTVGDVFNEFRSSLVKSYDTSEAEQITILVFKHVLNFRRIDISMFKNEAIENDKVFSFESILAGLMEGKPVQYVLGHSWFYGMEIFVNENVLIPRKETEELVEWIINDIRISGKLPNMIVDFCTGSGCIALALKKEFPEVKVMALDNSESALEVARTNSANLNLDIELMNMDVMDLNLDVFPGIIVSNPPYVLLSEKEKMLPLVTDHEPLDAIFVPGNESLIFYRKISEWALNHLNAGGKIYYEINERMGEEIQLLHSHSGFRDITLKKDLQNKDRLFRAVKN